MQIPPTYFWVSCVLIGCEIGLLALAYLVIQRGAMIFNFAIGGYAMAAGLSAAWLRSAHGWNLYAAIAFGLVLALVLALLTDALVVRPLHAVVGGQELPILVALTAVLFAMEQAAGTLFGRLSLPGVSWVDNSSVTVGDLPIARPTLFMMGMTVVIFAAVHQWSIRSTTGRMVQAVGDNPRAAEIIGLPVSKIRFVAFGIGGLVAALAGSLIAFRGGVHYDQGLDYAVLGFLTLVIAGQGSIWAPLVGGVLFATVQQLSVFYFGGAALDYATLALALVFFAWRPDGVFMRRKARV